ncbi:MAG: NADPH:quinone reductase [Planctomycetota bacterium]|mgnify:CR=1 FL=1|nr:MAG: NADPH:quinone reductase [Planctomycetota bacterium]REK42479.1 MAG: NADPH:quinone reductase [Planctomycetota bacterium]
MKAAFIHQPGPPENIVVDELPTPTPSGSEVLVRVAAAALNPIDTYLRAGAGYFELPRPYIVGCDLAGTVEAVGPEARRFAVGDRVWGSNQGLFGRQGTFAEYAAVDESWLYPTPDDTSDRQAAAIALVGITAALGLLREAKLTAGETLFVNGGTGGVGSTVVQMAKAIGARVIATGGTAEKVAACRELGADLAVNYKTEDVTARVKEFAPEGVNVYWETVREPDFDRAVEMLAPRGRMILMAGRQARPEFPVGPFYVKGCSLHGFVMFAATPDEQREVADAINAWLAEGKLRPRIDRVLPLDEAAAAHRLQEENTVGGAGTLAGKIVVEP